MKTSLIFHISCVCHILICLIDRVKKRSRKKEHSICYKGQLYLWVARLLFHLISSLSPHVFLLLCSQRSQSVAANKQNEGTVRQLVVLVCGGIDVSTGAAV